MLHVELGALAGDRGFRGGDVGLGLVERDLEVAVIDPRHHLTGRHALVVADQNFVEIAGDLRRDGGVVGLYIGVVRGNQETADRPVVEAIPGCAGQYRNRCSRHQEPTQPAVFDGFRGRRGAFRHGQRRGDQLLDGLGWKRLFGLEGGGMTGHGGPLLS